jgi:hypothetical protein
MLSLARPRATTAASAVRDLRRSAFQEATSHLGSAIDMADKQSSATRTDAPTPTTGHGRQGPRHRFLPVIRTRRYRGAEIANFGRKQARTAVSHRGRISVLERHGIVVRGSNERRGDGS